MKKRTRKYLQALSLTAAGAILSGIFNIIPHIISIEEPPSDDCNSNSDVEVIQNTLSPTTEICVSNDEGHDEESVPESTSEKQIRLVKMEFSLDTDGYRIIEKPVYEYIDRE